MRKIVFLLIYFLSTIHLMSQHYFSRVYKVPEDATGLPNVWPNHLVAVLPTDSLIFAFGYSADTLYPAIYGTAFYTFDLEGNLIDYYHIKENDTTNFFFPDGIASWDGITFYTSYNYKYLDQSILKFNRITRSQQSFKINNTIYKNGEILHGNLSSTDFGEIITASTVSIDSLGYNHLIQVTKIDTVGKIIWQTILGKPPINGYVNRVKASYVDNNNNIFIGIGYYNFLCPNCKNIYESLLYKLDHNGKIINLYNSDNKKGFCFIYDIYDNEKGNVFLSTDYNYNLRNYPYANQGYSVIQILDKNFKLIDTIGLDFRPFENENGPANVHSFEKIINNKEANDLLIGGRVWVHDTTIVYDSVGIPIDTIPFVRELLTLLNYNNDLQFKWKRHYRIREGRDYGFLYDLKLAGDGGYIIAAESFKGDAFEKYGEAYYMPWLLKLDKDGCLIPDCGVVKNKDVMNDPMTYNYRVFPNPFTDFIAIQHDNDESLHYTLLTLEGKFLENFRSKTAGENIIVHSHNWPAGSYLLKVCNTKGQCEENVLVKPE